MQIKWLYKFIVYKLTKTPPKANQNRSLGEESESKFMGCFEQKCLCEPYYGNLLIYLLPYILILPTTIDKSYTEGIYLVGYMINLC